MEYQKNITRILLVNGKTIRNAIPGRIGNLNVNYYIRHFLNLFLVIAVAVGVGCKGYFQSNTADQLLLGSFFSTSPVLAPLVVTASDSHSITIAQPVLITSGNPMPTVEAYIGPNGSITITGSTVSGTITEGPVDVSAGPYTFNALAGNTVYRIIVVAQNSSGYSVSQIVQSTGGIAPVMNALSTSGVTVSSITLDQPTFSTAGNPAPSVEAYIGPDGAITVTGSTVSGTITEGPVDVSAGPYTFNALSANTTYRIIVVAQNSSGYSVRQIVQSTGGIAPVMNALATSGVTSTSITIDQPTFATSGNPTPTVYAYIGFDGVISVAGSVVSNYTDGPYDVSGGAHQFTGLIPNTAYRIYVVAKNVVGFDVETIVQNTDGSAPVMNALSTSGVTSTTITINQPTFSTSGNPTPTVYAYIGFPGTISVVGSVVSGYTDGPYDVSGASHQFTGLLNNTTYRIIVVAKNVVGFDVESVDETTDP